MSEGMSNVRVKLTKRQRDALEFLASLPKGQAGYCEIYENAGTDMRTTNALLYRGFVQIVHYAFNVGTMWQITDAGRAAMKAMEEREGSKP